MSDPFYSKKLYPLQDRVLAMIGGVNCGFYLSGGTASSRGYLNHRYSDDLDFFVNDDDNFVLWTDRIIKACGGIPEWKLEIRLKEARFARFFIVEKGVSLKMEFINDVPSRVGLPTNHPVLGRLDSAENILANKVTAILDRREPKDYADIWGFCVGMNLDLTHAITAAQGKAAGIFPPDLARMLLSVETADWEAVRWINPPDREQYLAEVKRLGESLILPQT